MAAKKDLISSYWTKGTGNAKTPISDYWSTAGNAEVPTRKA